MSSSAAGPLILIALVDQLHCASISTAVAATVPEAQVRFAVSLADARAVIEAEAPGVVLCCRRFGGGRWRDVAALVERRSAPSVFVLVLPERDTAPDLTGTAVDELLWIDELERARLPLLVRRFERERARQALASAQRQLETTLAAEQERNRLIAELATEAIFFYDADMRVAFVNRAGLEMLGRPWDELRGLSIFDLVPADARERLGEELVRRREGSTDRLVFPATRGDGTRIWVQSSGRTILDRDGRRLGHLVVATDITDRVEREERLQRALADRESLLREVHHRVRNNFQIVFSLLNLQFADVGAGALHDRVRDMQNRVMTMALLHSLLYQADDVSAVDVDTYLAELLAVLRRSFDPAGARIVTHLDIAPLRLSLDACMRCGLIVNELVTNAFKHAFPDGRAGRVQIRLVRDVADGTAGALALYVEDDGIGFNMSAPRSGGLGLELVEDMARQLDGRLDITAGRGTRVCVTLVPGGVS